MRMLATGSNCLPAGGIGALAEQLASRLPADSIYTGTPAATLSWRAWCHSQHRDEMYVCLKFERNTFNCGCIPVLLTQLTCLLGPPARTEPGTHAACVLMRGCIPVLLLTQLTCLLPPPPRTEPKPLRTCCLRVLILPVGTKVDQVVAGSGSSPAVVKLAGGRSISASKGVVVAVEGPAAAKLLGQALQVCKGGQCRDGVAGHSWLHAHRGLKLLVPMEGPVAATLLGQTLQVRSWARYRGGKGCCMCAQVHAGACRGQSFAWDRRCRCVVNSGLTLFGWADVGAAAAPTRTYW